MSRRPAWLAALLLVGCREADPPDPPAAPRSEYRFTDVTAAAGIDFTHRHGGRGKRQLPETMGGGAAWLDVEGDGDLDLFLLQSGPLPDEPSEARPTNALYLNRGDGTFADGTAGSRDAARTGYGQGVCAGDADGDGRPDLYVTNYGPNVFLANGGDGGFDDRTEPSGLVEDQWGARRRSS
ncbi:MAG: FG-GAP repeat domain-containing protein, partial [Planctomycetota bacterium JB042]